MFTVRLASLLFVSSLFAVTARGQWELQASGTGAELRGIDNVGSGVAWASGTEGTVLRTLDHGEHWERCAVPPYGGPNDGKLLDLRGVQGLSETTAIVMASGRGALSRLYKTTDGCKTWKLVLVNPDKEGYFDALKMSVPLLGAKRGPNGYQGRVVGDPVNGKFVQYGTVDGGEHWSRVDDVQYDSPSAEDGEAMFAASNSTLLYFPNGSELFVTNGLIGARCRLIAETIRGGNHTMKYVGGYIPVASGTEDTGAFSVAMASVGGGAPRISPENKETVLYVDDGVLVAVGGNDRKPWVTKGTAAFSTDSGLHWTAAATKPGGYRSSVAYDAQRKRWIAVGLNGTDESTDDGRNWHALTPTMDEPANADKEWNAISLPYVVGPKGRIGVLRPGAKVPMLTAAAQ